MNNHWVWWIEKKSKPFLKERANLKFQEKKNTMKNKDGDKLLTKLNLPR